MRRRGSLGCLAGLVTAAVVTLAPIATASGDEFLTLVGSEDARTIELAPCHADKRASADVAKAIERDECPNVKDGRGNANPKPYLIGTLTLFVISNAKEPTELRLRYARKDGGEVVKLPGQSDVVFLLGQGSPQRRTVGAVLEQLRGRLPPKLIDRAGLGLTALAQLAIGRRAAALRVARSPQVKALMARALRAGPGHIPPLTLKRLAGLLPKALEPAGATTKLSQANVKALVKALGRALLPEQKVGATGGRINPDLAKHAALTAFDVLAARSALTLVPNKMRALPLRFALAPGETPSSLAGIIALELRSPKHIPSRSPPADPPQPAAGSTKTITLPVSASAKALGDIVFQPAKVVISAGGFFNDATEKVDLVGPGVRQLLAHRSPHAPTVRMQGGDAELVATLELPEAALGNDPDRVTATVKLSDDAPDPAKYEGDLPLSDLTPSSPKLEVEAHAHRTFLLTLGLLVLGTLVGGFLAKLVALARRRALLREALEESLEAYIAARAAGQPVAWDLSDLLGPEPWKPPPESEIARFQGICAIFGSIERARTSADLDEDTDRVLDMVARIQRWLRLEPVARRLVLVQNEVPGSDLPGLRWRDTQAWQGSQLLHEVAKREPINVDAADDLVARLLRQSAWHHRFKAAWEAADSNADQVKGLDKDAGKATALARTPEEQDDLDARLDTLLGDLNGVVPAMPAPETPKGLPPVVWSASPNLFTGWATLDGKSYGQLVRQAAATARTYSLGTLWDELKRIGWPDIVATLVAVGLACLVYLPTVYSDTWGSWKDMLTAFAAGLTGQVVVKWAALPAFQSLRLRARPAG